MFRLIKQAFFVFLSFTANYYLQNIYLRIINHALLNLLLLIQIQIKIIKDRVTIPLWLI